MKIGIILGTRPEIIKMSPIIRYCEKLSIPFFILHTGQHYSYEMDSLFFKQLMLPNPTFNLNIGSGSHAVQTAKILIGVEEIISREHPSIVLVQGDTNTVLGGALAAVKLNIPIGHIEAGLRSNDRTMPEEINRIVTDHLSTYLFTPTICAQNNLISEGIQKDKIFSVGNTIVDSVNYNLSIANSQYSQMNIYSLSPKQYVLVTLHRAENVDSVSRLKKIFQGLTSIITDYKYPVILPVHPRTKRMIEQEKISFGNILLINPVGYLEFLNLEFNAKIILTDSGGVQEEACILGVPCVTIRENTERPETIEVGSNILAGTEPDSIIRCFCAMLEKKYEWSNPYGDGKAGERIVECLKTKLL